MTENNEKRLTMRQELRAVAETKVDAITGEATKAIDKIAKKHGVERHDLVKAISHGSSKTAEHNLVTQLANKAEVELVALWNNQQKLNLGDKK